VTEPSTDPRPIQFFAARRRYSDGMRTRTRIDFDDLMRHLMVVGFAALTAWTIISTTGVVTGMLRISPEATLRFLLAVLVVVFARRTYWEVREWRWGRLSPDERFGFTSPLREDHLSPAGHAAFDGEDHRTRR
jgi:hypothetical protein